MCARVCVDCWKHTIGVADDCVIRQNPIAHLTISPRSLDQPGCRSSITRIILAYPFETNVIRRLASVTRTCFHTGDHGQLSTNRQPPIEALPTYGTPLPLQPKMKKITHITRNRKNKTFAIPADAAAMPPNPNTAATSAIIKKVTAQPNIVSPPLASESCQPFIPRVFITQRDSRC